MFTSSIKWLAARLLEPSSWAGLAALGAAGEQASAAATAGQTTLAIGIGLAGLVAFAKAEGIQVPPAAP